MSIQKKQGNRSKKSPRVIKITLIVFAVFIIVIIFTAVTMKPEELTISSPDMTAVSDGVFVGSADNGLVKATVSVTVKDNEIREITILEHDNLLGKPAEKITDDVIEKQTLEVDAISSATYSSTTILKAIDNAVPQKEQE